MVEYSGMEKVYSVAVVANNYSHDVATAFLAVSGVTMWILSKAYPDAGGEVEGYFVSIYQWVTKVARYSLGWIVIAGVPRIIFYRQYEWSDMAGDLQVVAIIIKHIVMFLLVGGGAVLWVKLDKKVQYLKRWHGVP